MRALLVPAAGFLLVCAPAGRALAQPFTAPCTDCAGIPAPVATRHLPRGTVLGPGDLQVVRVAPRGPRDSLVTAVTGWVTRRAVRVGEVLRPPAIAPRPLVTRGASVAVAVQVGDVQVLAGGVATTDAELGDVVAVRLGPKRLVHARVLRAGHVLLIDSLRTP